MHDEGLGGGSQNCGADRQTEKKRLVAVRQVSICINNTLYVVHIAIV